MKWHAEYLDLFLVPGGFFIMFGYHLSLLYRYLRHPETTVLGFENHSKKAWVKSIMQIDAINRGPAYSLMSNTIGAATFMASTSLALSSFIGAWVGSISNNQLVTKIIYGDTRASIVSIKYISMLLFFLLAFACFIQCVRCYVSANFLVSMPNTEVLESYVLGPLVEGAQFWELGLRSVYFAITLLMWMFGPIPMFVSSLCTVVVLHVIDVNRKPLHEFKMGKDLVKKIEEEISVVTKAIEHNAPDGEEVTASLTSRVTSTNTSRTITG